MTDPKKVGYIGGAMLGNKNSLQLTYGVLLVLAGLGVFYLTPQKMRDIEKIEHFSAYIPFIWFCFYFMGVLLMGGGIRKIYYHYRRPRDVNHAETSERQTSRTEKGKD